MKAAQITQYGDASVVAIRQDVPRPPMGGGKVLVEVHAASLNPADSSIRMGYMHQMIPLHFPATLGIDIAGVVVEADPGVGNLKAGDRVFGSASVAAGGSGAFAEYASVPAGLLAKAPAKLSFAEAAALPLAGVSALQALETLKLSKGTTIVIQGGSGGIGTFAVQMAKRLGARVIATSRGSAVDYVKSLGADQVIDFEKAGLPGSLRDCDAVFDTAGGAAYKSAFSVLKKGGTILTIAAQPDAELASKFGVTALGMMTDVATARLDRLAQLVTEGVKVHLDRVFPFDKIKDAFLARESGHVKGKIVVPDQAVGSGHGNRRHHPGRAGHYRRRVRSFRSLDGVLAEDRAPEGVAPQPAQDGRDKLSPHREVLPAGPRRVLSLSRPLLRAAFAREGPDDQAFPRRF